MATMRTIAADIDEIMPASLPIAAGCMRRTRSWLGGAQDRGVQCQRLESC